MAGESKDFKDEFFTQLKNEVVPEEPIVTDEKTDKLAELLSKKEQLSRTLDEEADPVKKMILKSELSDLEEEIAKTKSGEELGEKDSAEENLDEEVKEAEKKEEAKTEVDEQNKDLTKTAEEEKAQIQAKSAALREQYYASMLNLYNYRLANIETAKLDKQLVTTRESFEKEMVMEAEMYRLRDEYMALGNEDPFKEKRTELIEQERAAKEPIERELRERARKFKETEQEIAKLDKREKEINERLMNPEVSSVEMERLNKELEEIGNKRTQLERVAVELRKDLEPAINERTSRTLMRAGLEEKHLETLSEEDRKNYDYQQAKVNTMNENTLQGVNQDYRNIKTRIDEREQHIKDLKKELDRTPADDFERRLELLGKLDKETSMLEADRMSKSDIDRGVKLTAEEKQQKITQNAEREERREEDFLKATQHTREVIETQNKIIGESVVAAPVQTTIIDNQPRTVEARAATYAMVKDNPYKAGPDTPIDDYMQYRKAEIAASVIPGLENSVKDIEDPKEAEAYLKQDRELSKAHKELERQAEELTDKAV